MNKDAIFDALIEDMDPSELAQFVASAANRRRSYYENVNQVKRKRFGELDTACTDLVANWTAEDKEATT